MPHLLHLNLLHLNDVILEDDDHNTFGVPGPKKN